MDGLSPGFPGKAHAFEGRLPPGQYPTESFPVLSAGPAPQLSTEHWSFSVTTEAGQHRSWSWEQMMALPQEEFTVDIPCVTRWSKFDTAWLGVSLDVFLEEVESAADFVVAESVDGYTTNLPLEDITDDEPGFWEAAVYHDYGDPWREHRYWSD